MGSAGWVWSGLLAPFPSLCSLSARRRRRVPDLPHPPQLAAGCWLPRRRLSQQGGAWRGAARQEVSQSGTRFSRCSSGDVGAVRVVMHWAPTTPSATSTPTHHFRSSIVVADLTVVVVVVVVVVVAAASSNTNSPAWKWPPELSQGQPGEESGGRGQGRGGARYKQCKTGEILQAERDYLLAAKVQQSRGAVHYAQ